MLVIQSKKLIARKSDIVNFVKKTDFDNRLKNVTWNKNGLGELSKNVKAISSKGLINDLINKFSIFNGKKMFLQEYFKIIYDLNQLKSTLENIEYITKSD